METILIIAVAIILSAIAAFDAGRHKIPDILTIMLAAAGVTSIWVWPEISIVSRVIGVFIVSVPLLVVAVRHASSFGGGDIKLIATAGLMLGWKYTLVAALIAFVIGGIYSVASLAFRKKKPEDHFAFGPCLSVGIAISIVCISLHI
jgi:leader peptidase (prepilin peptidase)/N-methyltransferase